MILRPVRPQSPSGPPTTKLPVGLTRKSEGRFGIQPFGSEDSTAPEIRSRTMPGVYFLPLRQEVHARHGARPDFGCGRVLAAEGLDAEAAFGLPGQSHRQFRGR